MSLEAVVFQQLHSSSSYASTESITTTITTQKEDLGSIPTIRSRSNIDGCFSSNDQDTHPSTTLMNIVSPSSSSSNMPIQNSSNAEDSTIISRGTTRRRRKRRRSNDQINSCDDKSSKIEEERQRRKHIEVERNRRKQMNDYLSILRSLMPPSYSCRGDQASVVGGAINFVKELEQLLQYRKSNNIHSLFTEFFSFPQYSTTATVTMGEEPPEVVADVEVAVVERHVAVKVLSRKKPKQLLRMLIEMESAHLTVLHLNVTSIDGFVMYSFSLKEEDECQLNTVNEIAAAVYDMIRRIQRHSEFKIQPLQTLARTRPTMESSKTSLEQM